MLLARSLRFTDGTYLQYFQNIHAICNTCLWSDWKIICQFMMELFCSRHVRNTFTNSHINSLHNAILLDPYLVRKYNHNVIKNVSATQLVFKYQWD